MTVEKLLEELPPYLHVDGENNRCYLILTRDISGKWGAGYYTDDRYYYTVTADTPLKTLQELRKEIEPDD